MESNSLYQNEGHLVDCATTCPGMKINKYIIIQMI